MSPCRHSTSGRAREVAALDTLYSITLLFSLALGGIALAAALLSLLAAPTRWAPPPWQRPRALRRLLTVLAAAGLGCLAVSLLVHLGWGHRPGTLEALSLVDFVRIHPAFLAAAALPGLALLLRRRLPASD